MQTHVHKVIHKVVGTFGRVLRGREKWRLPLTPAELVRQDSVKKQRQKKVTGSDRTLASKAPACLVSSGRGTCEGLQRADAGCGAPVRPVHGRAAADASHQTRVVRIRCK
jgi:hypothetical protein